MPFFDDRLYPEDRLYVAPDAPARLRNEKTFKVPYSFSGQLEIRASDAAEAKRKAEQFSELQLAIAGDLEMGEPEEMA